MGTTRGSNARSDTRCTAPASQLGDRREEKRGGEAKEGERKRGWTGGKREGRREKKRWNSVVYPVIYNWKLGTTTRPKAIRRFHSGESSPFSVLAKVVRPSTIVDPPFLRLFLRAVTNPNSAFVRDSRVLSFSGCQPIRVRHGPTSPFHTRDKYSWYGVKNRWFGADRRKTVAPQDLVSPSLEMSASLCSAFRILILRLVNFYRERRMILSLSLSPFLRGPLRGSPRKLASPILSPFCPFLSFHWITRRRTTRGPKSPIFGVARRNQA